jgi:hypothetical protein
MQNPSSPGSGKQGAKARTRHSKASTSGSQGQQHLFSKHLLDPLNPQDEAKEADQSPADISQLVHREEMAQIAGGKVPAEMPNLVAQNQRASQRTTRGRSDTERRGREKVAHMHSGASCERDILLPHPKPARASNNPDSLIFDGPSGLQHVNMSMKNSLLLGDGANMISHIHGADLGTSGAVGAQGYTPFAGDLSSMLGLQQDLNFSKMGTQNLLGQLKLEEMRGS